MLYDYLYTEDNAYICAIVFYLEPTSFTKVKRFDEWLKAINEELHALEKTNTWSMCYFSTW